MDDYTDAELERMASPPPQANVQDLSSYSDAELEAVAAGTSVAGAVWEGVKHGATRAYQGLRQMGHRIAENVTPEGLVPAESARAYQENAARQSREYDRYLRRTIPEQEAALAPVREAHPLAFASGDIAGGIAVTAPATAVLPGSGLAGWAAQGAVQGLAQPALGRDYAQEKTGQLAQGAASGVIGGAALAGGAKGLVGAYNFPKQFLNVAQRRAMATPYAREGERIAQETGMSLSPAMVSGSRVATQAENISRQSMWSSDKALESYQMLSKQAAEHAGKLIDDWTAGRGTRDAASLGQELRDTTRNAVTVIHEKAGAQFGRDMDEVVRLAPPKFDFSETKNAFQKTIDENEFSVSPEGISLRRQAKEGLDRISALESAGIKNADMPALVDLVDNAYQRAAARFPQEAESAIGRGGFGRIINDRTALEAAYSRLESLARASPERVLGPRPPAPKTLAQAVSALGGLNVQHMPDIIGEARLTAAVRRGMPNGLFKSTGGRSPDDMARALADEGYLQPGDIAGDDGVRAMYERIGNELRGRGASYRASDIGAAQTRAMWDEAASRAMGAVVPDAMPVPGGGIPIKAAVALRREFGKAAKGSGNLFSDIHPSENRRLAGQMFGAINRDFESAANNASGNVGTIFKAANKNYKDAMTSIEYIENSVLGKVLGKDVVDPATGLIANTSAAAEKVVSQVPRLQPSQLQQMKIILEQHNPELLQEVKAFTLQQAMERGETLAPAMGTKVTFDPAKAAVGLLSKEQRAALYSPDEMRAVDTFDAALRRWADKHGSNFSGTAPTSEFLSVVNKIGVGALGIVPAIGSMVAGGPLGVAGAAVSAAGTGRYIFGTRQIAESMLNPGDRMQLLRLLQVPETSPQFEKIAAALVAKYATRQSPVTEPGQGDWNRGAQPQAGGNRNSP